MKILPIREIDKELINRFDCGNRYLNEFFYNFALQNDKKNLGKTFVCVENHAVIGFYTLANAQISLDELYDELKKNLPRYPVPCIRIARFAVDNEHHRKGIGSYLLKDALLKIVNISFHTGIYFVIVDAKDESKSFYEHFGFLRINDNNLVYLLPLATIKKAIEQKIIK